MSRSIQEKIEQELGELGVNATQHSLQLNRELQKYEEKYL
jgi:DNA integrity scanning protein DisA with diadenylate cyclase activity